MAVIDRIFTNAVGPEISVDKIRKALGELQLAYHERGFVTVASDPQNKMCKI